MSRVPTARSSRHGARTQNSAAAIENRSARSVPTVAPSSYASLPSTAIAPNAVAEPRQKSMARQLAGATHQDRFLFLPRTM